MGDFDKVAKPSLSKWAQEFMAFLKTTKPLLVVFSSRAGHILELCSLLDKMMLICGEDLSAASWTNRFLVGWSS